MIRCCVFTFFLLFHSVVASAEPIRVVLSGAPNIGKSSMISLLETKGWETLKETAIDYIHMRMAMRSQKPWEEPSFQTNINLLQQSREERLSPEVAVVFQDRSLIDSIGYSRARNQKIPDEIQNQIKTLNLSKRYYPLVFFMKPLPKEFQGERFDNKEAETIQKSLVEVYTEFGYTIVYVEPGLLEERVNFILDILKKEKVLPAKEPKALFSVESVKK